jgi:hypothetical protein
MSHRFYEHFIYRFGFFTGAIMGLLVMPIMSCIIEWARCIESAGRFFLTIFFMPEV